MSVKIIAELCQNHNGDKDILMSMIEEVANSGATHIKIQHIRPEFLNFRARHENGLYDGDIQKALKRPYNLEYERLSKLTLNDELISLFIKTCKENNLVPLTTCFIRADIPKIVSQGFKEIKVASYDCASYQMLRELAIKFDHIYVSTGATYDREVSHASSILKKLAREFSLLQCTTIYPTLLSQINLDRLKFLRQFTKNVGFSDHSSTENDPLVASKLALYHGAKVIERHFTILKRDETKDGPVSINPTELNELVKFSQLNRELQYENLVKNKIIPEEYVTNKYEDKGLNNIELLNRDYYRGRFVSPVKRNGKYIHEYITNWEETPLN